MTEPNATEHESNESDEDCEVYFLKPVNEYNIVEKIKEANKVLFEERTNISSSDDIDPADELITDPETGLPLRKVTFAPNLETYEPDNSLLEALKLTREFAEAVAEAKELDRKLTTICAYQTIVDEASTNEEDRRDADVETADAIAHSIAEALLSTDADTMSVPAVESSHTNELAAASEPQAKDDIVEEICEEIVVMDMENEQTQPQTTNTQLANQRRMVKLRTFDCAEEDPPEMIETEHDNRSLVNLLTSDGEEECCSAATFDINVDNSDLDVDDIDADTSTNEADGKASTDIGEELNSVNNDATNTDGYGDDEEEDDLSIIVASYLPDDFDPKSLGSGRLKAAKKSRRLLAPLSKRFSFRRKSLARNAIGATCADAIVEGGGGNRATSRICRPHQSPPDVTDLQLSYRTCCEYRRQLSEPEKLPKYTGYLSEYGLSRQQLELREKSIQRKQHYALQQALKTNDSEMRKMHDNERAFTTWLRNKMRFPINKTRNMFDVKRRSLDVGVGSGGGACGANSAVRNASGKRK